MTTPKDEASGPDRVRFVGLDKLLEHRVRLATCVLLSRYRKRGEMPPYAKGAKAKR